MSQNMSHRDTSSSPAIVPRYMQPLRITVSWLFLLFQIYLGITLYRFVRFVAAGGAPVVRADGVEGFLPISALMSLKAWVLTGEIHPVHPAALVIFVTVIAVSLLLKRSFCSWICPVGTISEALWKAGFRLFRRNLAPPRPLDIMLRGIKYLLLLFFLYIIVWQMPLPALLDFLDGDYNRIADIRLMDFFLSPSTLALTVIGILGMLSVAFRSPFCRFLCPYGGLLGIVSVASPVKVHRNQDHCVSCGVCNRYCPAGIPVMSMKRVHSEECIGCWRCISNCRSAGTLEMKGPGGKFAVHALVFAALVVGVFVGGTVIGKMTGHWKSSVTTEEYRRILSGPPPEH